MENLDACRVAGADAVSGGSSEGPFSQRQPRRRTSGRLRKARKGEVVEKFTKGVCRSKKIAKHLLLGRARTIVGHALQDRRVCSEGTYEGVTELPPEMSQSGFSTNETAGTDDGS